MSDLLADISRAAECERKGIFRFLFDVLRVPSVTSSEGALVPVCVSALEDLGFEVELQHVDSSIVGPHFPFLDQELHLDRRPNIIARLAGTKGRRTLVFNTHLDVTPAVESSGWRYPPFSPVTKRGRVFGRGAADAKGGMASIVGALRILKQLDITLACDLQIQLVIGQETGGVGTISAILQNPEVDAVILAKPTSMRIVRAQSGHLKYSLEVPGKSVLPAVPWEGVSAFDKLIEIYGALEALSNERNLKVSSPLFDKWPNKAPFSVGRVRAGDYPFTIPGWAIAEGRFGILPGELPDNARLAVESTLARLADQDPWMRQHPPVISWTHGMFTSWETKADDPLIGALTSAAEKVAGRADVTGVTFGSDASHFVNLSGASVAVFGPGDIGEGHSPNESVLADDVIEAAKIFACAVLCWDGVM